MSALMGTVTFDGTMTPSRLKVLKPVRLKVMLYVPGRRSTIE
jgi:hypothetical protein